MIGSTRNFFSRFLASSLLGLVFFIFSEEFFWGFYRRGTTILDYLETYLFYVLFAYIFLILLYWSRASNIWEIYLIGAIYGWVIEGLFVQTVYENIPYSISWTSLAWHALITVLVGFYIVYQSVLENNYRRLILVFTIIGLLWGILATFWIIDLNYLPSILEFSLFVLTCSLLLSVGYFYFIKLIPEKFNLSKPELIILLVILSIVYIVVASKTVLLIVLWTPLIIVTLLCLRKIRQRRIRSEGSLELIPFYDRINYLKKIRVRMLLIAPLMIPLFSTITYSIQVMTRAYLGFIYMISIYIIMMPLGFIIYVISILKLFLKQNQQNTDNTTEISSLD